MRNGADELALSGNTPYSCRMKAFLALLVAAVLGGCTSDDRPDHVYRGTPETGFVEVTPPSRTQTVLQALDSTAQAIGDFGRGYSNASQQYQETHPHGTMTATTVTPGEWPSTTYIHY
jgi:hypothetical protein